MVDSSTSVMTHLQHLISLVCSDLASLQIVAVIVETVERGRIPISSCFNCLGHRRSSHGQTNTKAVWSPFKPEYLPNWFKRDTFPDGQLVNYRTHRVRPLCPCWLSAVALVGSGVSK